MQAGARPTASLDPDYLAICIAEQIVRVKLSAAHSRKRQASNRDLSVHLVRPLWALADALGLTERVEALVAEAIGEAAGAASGTSVA